MEQEFQQTIGRQPSLYTDTAKATVLALIKLIEALAAGYALYYILANPAAVQGIVDVFYEGFSFHASAKSAFVRIYQILHDSIHVILAFELLLLVLDGLGSFLVRAAHRGAGLVRLVHIVRYIFTIAGFIGSLVLIFEYTMAIFRTAQTLNKVSFGDLFTYLGSYELVIFVILLLGAFWILLAYDRCVAGVMKQVSTEIKAGTVLPLKKRNHLGREAIWLAGILGLSAALSIVELAAGESTLASIADYFKPIEILYKGSGIVSISVTAVMALKYFLVFLCSADFDSAH